MDIYEQLENFVKANDIKNVELLLNNPKINPSFSNNRVIMISAVHGYIEILKLFLNDNRIDPTDRKNSAIILGTTTLLLLKILISLKINLMNLRKLV